MGSPGLEVLHLSVLLWWRGFGLSLSLPRLLTLVCWHVLIGVSNHGDEILEWIIRDPLLGLLRWLYYCHTGGHVGRQIPHDRLVTVIRLLQALMLLIISSPPNLLTAWYSALCCPSNHSDINANVFENGTLHESPWTHVAENDMHLFSLPLFWYSFMLMVLTKSKQMSHIH
jgi:hypothetical protein